LAWLDIVLELLDTNKDYQNSTAENSKMPVSEKCIMKPIIHRSWAGHAFMSTIEILS